MTRLGLARLSRSSSAADGPGLPRQLECSLVPRPYIISYGAGVYRLSDGAPVLVGRMQHAALQVFLSNECAYLDPGEHDDIDAGCVPFVTWADSCMDTEEFLTELGVHLCSDYKSFNLAAVMRSLKRGPLGRAIRLPGHKRKGRGYSVRILGVLDGVPDDDI